MKIVTSKNPDLFIFLALLFQFIVFILRVSASLIWNNYALLIESFHIAIDISITVLVLISLKISRSNLRNRYSYGLYKMEDLISLFIAIIVAYSAFDIIRTSFIHPPTGDLQSSIIQIISLIPLFLAGRMKILSGNLLNSPSLKSDGLHTYTDVYEGLGVAVGLFLNYITNNVIFYYAAITIAALTLFYTSYEIGKDSIISLLDLPKDKSVLKKINELVRENKNIRGIKSTKVRWAGPVIFAEIVLVVNPKLTIEEAHLIADEVEDNVYKKMPEIKDIVIHLEPSIEGMRTVAIPLMDEKINEKFSRASNYMVYKIDINGQIKKEKLSVSSAISEKRNAQRIQRILVDNLVTDVIVLKIGEIANALLREKGIRIWKAQNYSPDENIELFLKGELKEVPPD
ncbi:MAG: cation diffusion facilitator family transporter [Thermoplasmata archaeon]